jgi:hypothetical protein
MKKSELINELAASVEHLQKIYNEQREIAPLKGNPYIVGLGARLNSEKEILNKIKQLESLD